MQLGSGSLMLGGSSAEYSEADRCSSRFAVTRIASKTVIPGTTRADYEEPSQALYRSTQPPAHR